MKKLIALVLALLLFAPSALAEASGCTISIRAWEMEQLSPDETLLHLLLLKQGTSSYRLEELQICLYDGQGNPMEVTSAAPVVFPMREIPAGSHYLPVTLRYTLAQPAQAADFTVTGVVGMQTETPGAEECVGGVPWIGGWRDGCVTVTAWVPMAGGAAAEDYLMSLVAVDAEGGYLGNGELPAGAARYVSGTEIVEAVCAACGWTPAQLEEQGFAFGAEGYAFFDNVPVPYLLETPSGFVVGAYRLLNAHPAMPIVRSLERLDVQEDGSFAIHGCFACTEEGLWALVSVETLTLLAADGTELPVADFSFDAPFSVMEEGGVMPYVIRGQAAPGVEAAGFDISYLVSPAEALEFHTVPGGSLVPGLDAQGHVTLNVTMPQDASPDPADCFVIVMFLDLTNDVYQGAVWTYPGEGWLQEGVIRLPEMTAPAGCSLEAAMATMYCVWDGR